MATKIEIVRTKVKMIDDLDAFPSHDSSKLEAISRGWKDIVEE
jgi:hypothetical protein